MIFKNVIIVFVLMQQMLPLYSQEKRMSTFEKKYYDVDSVLTFKFDSIGNSFIITYYDGLKENRTCLDVEFKGGYKSLSSYCDSLYFNREDYNYDELNEKAMYTILFDHNLNIKDVRILKRFAYTNKKYNYDDLIKRILLSTEGKWYKTGQDDCEWYFRLGYFNLR